MREPRAPSRTKLKCYANQKNQHEGSQKEQREKRCRKKIFREEQQVCEKQREENHPQDRKQNEQAHLD